MSGSQPGGAAGQPETAADPSMEDILASIRRILSEDEAAPTEPAAAPPPAPPPPAAPPPDEADESDVLALDASMLVAEPSPPLEAPPEPPPPSPTKPEPPPPFAPLAADPGGLMAAEPVAAAASSVGSLVRTLAGHGMAVYRGGPTLEDIVREEMRPMLKAWLDEYLPPLVERLVRAEIDRVVGRALSS